jgi:hypothetical protein
MVICEGTFFMVGVCKWVDVRVYGDTDMTGIGMEVLYPWSLFPRTVWGVAILLVHYIQVTTDQLDMALTIATLVL